MQYKQIVKKASLLCMTAWMVSCGSTKKMTDQVVVEEETVIEAPVVEETTLPEMVVSAPAEEIKYELPVYNPAAERKFDLLDTKLDIRFDWENQHVIGKADIKTTPLFYDQNKVTLDAVGFDINAIKIDGRTAKYDYDGRQITIDLPRTYKKGDVVNLFIDYVAKPNEAPEGGSAAITSDKGLFFINPLGEEKDKPKQIWTQGETESNSKWFPTFDKPNERTTQQITLTVNDEYETLSNGLRISSKKNADGTRTDVWKQDKPHAPYLFFVGVGDFAEIQDKWKDIPLTYMVEHDYAPYAKEIFDHTPEMLSFFSEKLDYKYPWDKYSQIICRDYVSGAMENTSAVIFGEFVQKTDRELIDNDNDYIVAHEMMHHWFGDLVTCESWANLTLNEGFANYSEYLWAEHHDGVEHADHHRLNEMQGYFASSENQGVHPLIHYGYNDKEDMFDAHSYNKGGLVLHMLRNQIGEKAFFAGCNKYLRDNEYTAVEVDELRMAMEDVTGLDLNWFWDQWFHAAGHPVLDIKHNYDATNKSLTLDIQQTQTTDNGVLPIFVLPMQVALYNADGVPTIYPITVDAREQKIVLENVALQPSAVVVDATASTLAMFNHEKTEDEWINQVKFTDKLLHMYNAVRNLQDKESYAKVQDALLAFPHYSMRAKAVREMDVENPSNATILENLAQRDPHSSVRAAAINAYSAVPNADIAGVTERMLLREKAYPVIGSAISAMYTADPANAIKHAKLLEKENTDMLTPYIGDVYAKTGDAKYLAYFEDKLETVGLYSMYDFYGKYYGLLKSQDIATNLNAAKKMGAIATNMESNMYRRFFSMNTLAQMKMDMSAKKENMPENTEVANALTSIQAIIDGIKSKETNEMLKQRYQAF